MQRCKGWGGGDPYIGWGLEGHLEGFGFHSECTGTLEIFVQSITCSDLGISRFTWLWAGERL